MCLGPIGHGCVAVSDHFISFVYVYGGVNKCNKIEKCYGLLYPTLRGLNPRSSLSLSRLSSWHYSYRTQGKEDFHKVRRERPILTQTCPSTSTQIIPIVKKREG